MKPALLKAIEVAIALAGMIDNTNDIVPRKVTEALCLAARELKRDLEEGG